MNSEYYIEHRDNLDDCLVELHKLLDICYPNPPQDVFYRLVAQYRPGFPAWIARAQTGDIAGFVHLAPNSKGGTLETLAVSPEHRGRGIAHSLVLRLVQATDGVVSLTTRIPDFFKAMNFENVMKLEDGSIFMIRVKDKEANLL